MSMSWIRSQISRVSILHRVNSGLSKVDGGWAKIATYVVSIGPLLCLAFIYGWRFFK